MQKRNVPTDRVQMVDEKNGVICLVIMFTQEDLLVALKCFKTFCCCQQKIQKRAMLYILITITLELNMIFTIF